MLWVCREQIFELEPLYADAHTRYPVSIGKGCLRLLLALSCYMVGKLR